MTTKGVILEQAAPSTTRVEADGSGANPPLTPETEAEASMWEKASPWVHGLLGVASFVPGLSVVTGAVDAAIYAAEGEAVEAGLAVASMIPGGKVATTVGKVAKGAVEAVQGAGAAARVVKGTHEAEQALKAAKQAEDAAKAAREAREARDAAQQAHEAASGASKPKKEVTIKGREHKVPCFHPYDKKTFMQMSKADQKAYLSEMAAQLKRQENAINSLTATEYMKARDLFDKMKRNPAANAAQAASRKKFGLDLQANIKESLQRSGMGAAQAKREAARRADHVMDKLAALHEPDMVAGGWMHPEPKGMGRADVNSSIGASWNQSDRVAGMDREADEAINSGRGDQKMNVKLEPCRGKELR